MRTKESQLIWKGNRIMVTETTDTMSVLVVQFEPEEVGCEPEWFQSKPFLGQNGSPLTPLRT